MVYIVTDQVWNVCCSHLEKQKMVVGWTWTHMSVDMSVAASYIHWFLSLSVALFTRLLGPDFPRWVCCGCVLIHTTVFNHANNWVGTVYQALTMRQLRQVVSEKQFNWLMETKNNPLLSWLLITHKSLLWLQFNTTWEKWINSSTGNQKGDIVI